MKRLFTICLVLLLCTSAYAVKVSATRDVATAVATVDTVVDALALTNADILAMAGVGTGNVFYVDSAATGSGTGLDWTNAEITIELGLSNCTANAGDIIVCAPYHAETASTTTLDLDLDGVTVIGLGKGDAMTTITYDATTDIVNMGGTGDGCTIRNIKFYTATDNIAMAILVEDGCTDFVIEDCVFEATSTDEFIDAIYIDGTAANEGIIRRNRFLGDIASNTAPQSSIGFEDAHWLQIYDNEFSGDMGVAHIENKTTASNFITIRDNRFLCGYIGDGASTLDTVPGITAVATTTGWIYDNFVVTNVATPDLSIVAADCYVNNNSYSEVQGNVLVPGQMYAMEMTSTLAAQTDVMFTVSGGPIEIVTMFGLITTVVASTPGDLNVEVDATTDAQDADFSTAVTLTDTMLGDVITFDTTTAGESVLVATVNVNANLTQLSWFCPIGVITQGLTGTGTGAITWYMVFRPLTTGVTVVAG